MLQFFQDELRDEQGAVDESRLTYIGNASVDDDARIEQLVELGRFLFLADLPQRFLGLCLRLRFAALADQIRQRAEKIADFLALLDRDMNADTMLKTTGKYAPTSGILENAAPNKFAMISPMASPAAPAMTS